MNVLQHILPLAGCLVIGLVQPASAIIDQHKQCRLENQAVILNTGVSLNQGDIIKVTIGHFGQANCMPATIRFGEDQRIEACAEWAIVPAEFPETADTFVETGDTAIWTHNRGRSDTPQIEIMLDCSLRQEQN